ncbi:MAG: hypothetical protein JJT75_09085 [Opitutales bacterium]|nr:hypothetical protein [Opitutales bacterium]
MGLKLVILVLMGITTLPVLAEEDRDNVVENWLLETFPELHENAGIHLLQAKIFLKKQDYANARKELKRAQAREPNNPEITDLLIDLAIEEGDFEKALRHAREAFAFDSSAENELRLANLLLSVEENEEALGIIARHGDRFVRQKGDWSEFFALLRTIDHRNNLDRIIHHHLMATDGNFEAKIALAEFFIGRGNFTDARNILWDVYTENTAKVENPPEDQGFWDRTFGYELSQEFNITIHAVEIFPHRLVNLHPLLQRERSHQAPPRDLSEYSPPPYPQVQEDRVAKISINRSRALGNLIAMAMVENEEEQFAEKWNQHLEGLPAHRILSEKMKVDHFDSLFLETLQAVSEGQLSLDPYWEGPLYQLFQRYLNEGRFADLPSKKREPITRALAKWQEQIHAGTDHSSTMVRLYKWAQQIDTIHYSQDQERVLAELDGFIEELADNPEIQHRLNFFAIQLAHGYNDFDMLLERYETTDFSQFPEASYAFLGGILRLAIEDFSTLWRPLEDTEKRFLRQFLNDVSLAEAGHPKSFPDLSQINNPGIPFHESETLPSGLLLSLYHLHHRQKQVGANLDWQTMLPLTDQENISPARKREIQTLEFFVALWEENYSQAKMIGQNILNTGEDAGIRLNLALLKEREGNIQSAITLLQNGRTNHIHWDTAKLWKIIQLASTDKDLYPHGQVAVRQLALNWEIQHQQHLHHSLEELYQKVGLADEWEREQKPETAEAPTTESDEPPRWQVLAEKWRRLNEEQIRSSAREILENAPLGYKVPEIRRRELVHYCNLLTISNLRRAKSRALNALLDQRKWEDYIAKLKQEVNENPYSIEPLARLIEALEFPRYRPVSNRSSTRMWDIPEEDPWVKMRVSLTEDRIEVQRRIGERWRNCSSVSFGTPRRRNSNSVYGRKVKAGILLSGGLPDQKATMEIKDVRLLTTDGEEIPLEFRPLTPEGEKEPEFSYEETDDGRWILSSGGGATHTDEMEPHGLFLGTQTNRFSEIQFSYKATEKTAEHGGHHGIFLKTLDEQGDELFYYFTHLHEGIRATYRWSKLQTSTDPVPYYHKAIALRPDDDYFIRSLISFHFRQKNYDDFIELFEGEEKQNPYLVLRRENNRLKRAYDRSGKIPQLVDVFLENPALSYNLGKLNQQTNLGEILEGVAEYLAEWDYPEEAAKVRKFALSNLSLTESVESRLRQVKTFHQEGDLDSARPLLYDFFETTKKADPSPFLVTHQLGDEAREGNWLKQFSSRDFSNENHLPHPFLLMQTAPPDLVAEFRARWLARHPNFPEVDDPAEALLGAIIHWTLRHPEFPKSLQAVGDHFGPKANLSPQKREWFQQEYQFPLLELLHYFSPSEELAQALYSVFIDSTEGQRGGRLQKMFRRSEDSTDAFLQYRTALAIKGIDDAWQYQEKVFSQLMEGRRPDQLNHPVYALALLREAGNRLEPQTVQSLIQKFLNSGRLGHAFGLRDALLWELERLSLREGKVRNPYVSSFWLPPSEPSGAPKLYYEISGIHPEDRTQRSSGNREPPSSLYGENFAQLDGKFDLLIEYSSNGNESETSKTHLSSASASGTVELQDATTSGTLTLTLKDAASGEKVYTRSLEDHPLGAGRSVLPPLLSNKGEDTQNEIRWEWLGTPPRIDPIHTFPNQEVIYFPGFGRKENDVARTNLIPIGDAQRIIFQALAKDRVTNRSPFRVNFYNEQGEKIGDRWVGIRHTPERWEVLSHQWEKSSSSGGGFRNRFSEETTHVEIIIRANTPLSIANLALLFSPE